MVNAIGTNMLVEQQPASRGANSFADLASGDFLKLLITQLTTQDPMEPTGNEELLKQIASIREIELSTALTDSLSMLTGQQRFTSASELIGKHVTGLPGPDGAAFAGIVTGVRFEDGSSPVLQLANGSEIALDRVSAIEPPLRAGEALVGQAVVGLDRSGTSAPEIVEGVVTSARMDEQGEVVLELDSGQAVRLRDLMSAADVGV